ncbi:hypothetical protein ABH935_009824 [Catenulispora sp. GAS73]
MKLTGWSVEQINDTPAVTLDWLLACADAEQLAEANRERHAQEAR